MGFDHASGVPLRRLQYTHRAMAKKKKATRRKKTAPKSVGLTAGEVGKAAETREVRELTARVEDDGGAVLGTYNDPFGGSPVLLVALPIDSVEPTPYQRDPSEPHVKRLMTVIEKVGRFLDPLVIVRNAEGYWTPNGNHRLQAMRKLGARTITGLLVPESDVAFKILALNTEKAHNVKEKSLETIRMARALSGRNAGKESDYAFEFEQAPFLTLGAAYEQRRSLSGGAYSSILRRIDDFLDDSLPKAVRERERRAAKLLKLDDAVSSVVAALKERGLTSPYLKPFVIARVNPIRFSKSTEFDFDEVMDKTIAAATRFKVDRVKQEDVAKIGGGPPPEED
jgi:ParB family chromosome partitioning protein